MIKTKSRLGKADSIFASTTPKKTSAAASHPDIAVASPAGSSIENKLTVIIPPGQVAFLDRLCLDIRTKTKAKIRRTEIIRALVTALEMSGIDLTDHGSEAEIASAIGKSLKG